MAAVAERRVACALEVGPGTTLSRLWNARYPSTPARSVDEFKTPAAVARWVAATMG
jgi:[acyl-carrier-protein] S-malonyltransferase